MQIIITKVNIDFIKPQNGLFAFASVIINGQFCLSSIGIHKKKLCREIRLTYPSKKNMEKQSLIFYPITKEASKIIEIAIFNKVKEVINDRHNSPYVSWEL
jgi:DNA-binding cell septation regulator SpoVG